MVHNVTLLAYLLNSCLSEDLEETTVPVYLGSIYAIPVSLNLVESWLIVEQLRHIGLAN